MPDIAFLPFSFPGLERVRVAFQQRGGDGARRPQDFGNISLEVEDDPAAVVDNRRALRDALGFSGWAELHQVHSDAFVPSARAGALDRPGHIDADGFATGEPGLALVIKTADCQPLLLAHEDGAHVAALHVGWRGNRINFPASGVRAFCAAYGFAPRELFAVRGPSLGPANARFVNAAAEWPAPFMRWFDPERQTMDLWAMTRDQLLEVGVRFDRIFGIDRCTFAESDRFFSFRSDRRSGRQASLIWIEKGA